MNVDVEFSMFTAPAASRLQRKRLIRSLCVCVFISFFCFFRFFWLSCVELKNTNYTLKSWHFRLFRIAETKTQNVVGACVLARARALRAHITARIIRQRLHVHVREREIHWNECCWSGAARCRRRRRRRLLCSTWCVLWVEFDTARMYQFTSPLLPLGIRYSFLLLLLVCFFEWKKKKIRINCVRCVFRMCESVSLCSTVCAAPLHVRFIWSANNNSSFFSSF